MSITIKAARVNAGFTQLDVAKALSKNKQTIANYENYVTEIPIGVALEMAKLFGMSVDDIKWAAD